MTQTGRCLKNTQPVGRPQQYRNQLQHQQNLSPQKHRRNLRQRKAKRKTKPINSFYFSNALRPDVGELCVCPEFLRALAGFNILGRKRTVFVNEEHQPGFVLLDGAVEFRLHDRSKVWEFHQALTSPFMHADATVQATTAPPYVPPGLGRSSFPKTTFLCPPEGLYFLSKYLKFFEAARNG